MIPTAMLLKRTCNSYLLKPVLALTLATASIMCGGDSAADESNPAAGSPAPTSKLNDTGITWGADYPKGNIPRENKAGCNAKFDLEFIKHFQELKQLVPNDPIQGDILSQQDCKHGRDVTANDDRDGDAGFVYRKVDKNGKILDASAKNWDCVLDEVSGLLWEMKKYPDRVFGNQGLHDGDDLFTWYNPNVKTNGGLLGDWNSGINQCAGYKAGEPATYCNMEEFSIRVNQQGLCGFKDWRMPTVTELATLPNFGRSNPAIDTDYFPFIEDRILRSQHYWSSTPSLAIPETAWAFSLQYGEMGPMNYRDTHTLILVRNWTSATVKSAAK